jgi:sugar-specific transcriptional regulator TrmB
MLKTLVNLGFKQQEAEVYVFLASNGSQEARDIADALKAHKRQVYRILKRLKNKEIVNATSSLPAKFSAVSPEKVLDLFMKTAMEQAKVFQASRKELLSTWRSMNEKDSSNS